MSYLLCRQCNGYFELTPTESPHDFENCCCGGPLRYIKNIASFSKKIQSESEDELEIDNTIVIFNHLKDFKERIGYSNDLYHNEDYFYDLDDEKSTEEYEIDNESYDAHSYNETPYKDINKTLADFSELMPRFKEDNKSIPALTEVLSEYRDSPAKYYEEFDSESSGNQYIEYSESPEPVNYQYEQDLEYIENEYFDPYSQNDLLYLSKRYISNHWATILAFGILPLEYVFLFGTMSLNVMASFAVAVPMIMSYLPRASEIKMHEDVTRVCSVWVIYLVISVLILLTWAMLNLVKMPLIYL